MRMFNPKITRILPSPPDVGGEGEKSSRFEGDKEDGPIRVCFLIDNLSRAGTESQLLALIRSLDRSRVEPFLVLLDGENDLSRSLEPADCPVLRLGVRSFRRLSAISGAVRFGRFLRQHRIDILQAYFIDSVYFGVPVAKLAGVRHTLRVRNNLSEWLTPKHRRLGRQYGRTVDATLTNCEAGRQAILQAESLRPERVIVLENGVDLDRFRRFEPPDTARPAVRIGAVANLRPVKNIDLFIQAAAELCKGCPNLQFEVAGDGPERGELEDVIAKLNLEGRFRLLGPVADAPAFLASLDIAVLCSKSEGMSNALLEYMAAGRAIVATSVGANSKLLCDGEHGVLIHPNSIPELVAAIERLLKDPELARRIAASARQHVEACFSREAMCRRFEEFYSCLVHGTTKKQSH
ncbi:MAG TPA: glycosyltransferase [Gemmataceae bacterium]|nr:glycosyltransferase [Gemmataceae bacterium]